MATNERSVELAGVNLAGQNHVCAFFNTMDEEHRVLGSFYKDGFDRSDKATPYGQRIKRLGSKTSVSRRVVRCSGRSGDSVRSLRPEKGRGEDCPCLDGFSLRENDPRTARALAAGRPRRTRSISTGTPLLPIDATVPNSHSNWDCVVAV